MGITRHKNKFVLSRMQYYRSATLVVLAACMALLLGTGTAVAVPTFSKNVLDPTIWGGALVIGTTDIDLDGDQDVVGLINVGSSDHDVRVFSNDGAGNFTKIIDVLGSNHPGGCSGLGCPVQLSQWTTRLVLPGDLSGDA